MSATVFDNRVCTLGEGPFWHPTRKQLFWFDIVNHRLLSRLGNRALDWRFDEPVSAAGWIDHDTLLIASASALLRFDIDTGDREDIVALEARNRVTRSNDGRADPHGGFWIGTMGHAFEPGAGSIYRYYRGQLEKLYDGVTVSNSICFAPDGRTAYWTDTTTRRILRQDLDGQGWPDGAPDVFVDLTEQGYNPDGAVVDSEGAVWSAHWNAGMVARYLPDGRFDRMAEVGGRLASCPEFGGTDLSVLYVTTATMGMRNPKPGDGQTYEARVGVTGLPQYRVEFS
ncbi:SMP-30/gluconolactonase/LRE family protein [Maritimibacter dapengensis]|uniref:SMP-30/gluconolactonase/LRE family protein n=1 Tax=Maritimibacter dapengensis TaxID=2836868 RepID=A0ABS6T3J9_9RHOB|nr:SMP-30/gluconolactonase/LRE family protein [Maritimibacter dapengensis]MBV7378917.1 SMP-30/gluconolactonase/LRE family protein [Maritimibacter dapengensis]